MTTAHFVAHISGSREISEVNVCQSLSPSATQTHFSAEVRVECATDDRSIDVEFLARADVPMGRFAGFSSQNGRKESVGLLIASQLPQLAKRSRWDIYRSVVVTLTGQSQIEDIGETDTLEIDLELNEVLAVELLNATNRHRQTAMQFDEAKRYLEHNINHIMHVRPKATLYASFVADCMKYSGSPERMWRNKTNAETLVCGVADLASRKSSGHQSYQGIADNIRSILFSASVGKLWHATPPTLGI